MALLTAIEALQYIEGLYKRYLLQKPKEALY